ETTKLKRTHPWWDTNATACYSRFLPMANTGCSNGATPGASDRTLAAGGLQVGVTVELVFVEALQHLAFRDRHPAVADRPLTVSRQGGVELRHVILHVLQHLVGRVALDDLLDPPAAFVMETYVHHVCVAEEVMQVPERFLVSTHQEGRQVVFLSLLQLV